jgi:hypothetical protein
MVAGEDGLACLLLLPGAHAYLDKGTESHARLHLVPSCENGRRRVVGMQPPAMDACGSIDCLSTCS